MENFICKFKKSLSNEKCKDLIDLFKKDELKKKIRKGPINEYTKVNNTYFYEFFSMKVTEAIIKELEKPITLYLNKFKFLSEKSLKIEEYCNLQKYIPGNSYTKEHCENSGEPNHLRNLAWMFYLNDINDEGGTFFPSQNLTLTPHAGDLYIWPAYWTHSHRGIPSKTEEKFILTGWCRFLSQKEKDQMKNV